MYHDRLCNNSCIHTSKPKYGGILYSFFKTGPYGKQPHGCKYQNCTSPTAVLQPRPLFTMEKTGATTFLGNYPCLKYRRTLPTMGNKGSYFSARLRFFK